MATEQKPGKRSRLIQAAMSLVYKQGFGETRLADIAADANVPPGNVYYYFKTKEEIGAAIVDERLSQIKMLHQKLDELDAPEARLCAFVQMTLDNRKNLARGGCPIGTLCTELHKEDGSLAKHSTVLFAEILAWLKSQFAALGKGRDSQGLAVHLLSALQGIAVVSHALGDPEIVVIEAQRLQRWIRALETRSARET
ncbi:MAG TPA: TetR/AcrR family transcriptional regulator [Terriglobales bacterium]|jgi:AcrR family transcriptional regulator|nr:TetR/AcrR family transcriptional regulator [Terriglobales bacterium]